MLEKVPPRPGPSPSPSPSPGPSPSPSPNQARISPEFAKKLVIKTSVADNGRRSAAGRRLSVALGAKGLQNVAEFAKRASNVEMMDYSEDVNRCVASRRANPDPNPNPSPSPTRPRLAPKEPQPSWTSLHSCK